MTTPSRFGRYEVLEPLGQGAMGAVYKARDPAIDRTVAVKTVGGALLAFPEHREEFLARFRQEARAAGRLSHTGIVSVYDVGVDEATGTPFIVMEYVPGVSLATVLHENPALPVAQALDIVEQVGAALEEAHAQGIVHRDIKPGNVFLDTRGRVKVGDFGIARVEGSELTQTGVGLGTPGYLAPEVLRGAKADARSDLFALGVVAYTLLAGRRPFQGPTVETLGLQVLQHDPPPPHEVRPEVPGAVSDAVMRALAKSPEQRTASVGTFLADLRAGRESTATVLPPAALPSRRVLLAVGLVALAALLLAGALLALRDRGEGYAVPASPAKAASTPRPTAPVAARPPTPTPAKPPAEDPGDDKKDGKKDDHGKSHGKGKKKGH